MFSARKLLDRLTVRCRFGGQMTELVRLLEEAVQVLKGLENERKLEEVPKDLDDVP